MTKLITRNIITNENDVPFCTCLDEEQAESVCATANLGYQSGWEGEVFKIWKKDININSQYDVKFWKF